MQIFELVFSNLLPSTIGMSCLFVLIIFTFTFLMGFHKKFIKYKQKKGRRGKLNNSHKGSSKKSDDENSIKSIFLLSALILLGILFTYYLTELYLLQHFPGEDKLDIYEKGTTVVITVTGVIITAIFSYLVFVVTKQGLDISRNSQATANRMEMLEENRRKDEITSKYSNISTVPQIQLLHTIDEILEELYLLENAAPVAFADMLSEGVFLKKMEELTVKYKDNFLVNLFLSEFMNTFYAEEKFISEKAHKIKLMRIKALFADSQEEKDEILEHLGFGKLLKRSEKARSNLVNEIKKDISLVYGNLLNEQEMNILDSHEKTMDFIWRGTQNSSSTRQALV